MSEEEIDRKITVIFATDVVGYSKHMEADESGTVKNLRACEKILTGLFEKHKGRLFNTGGDSFLAEFPSAVSAVECAVEFQKAIKERNSSEEASVKLQFRIGINSGDVIKEKDNLLGDGVNIAARLEALAQSGGITISKLIYDYVKGKTQYEFNDLGIQKVKLNEFHAFDLLLSPEQKRKLINSKSSSILSGRNLTVFGIIIVLAVSLVSYIGLIMPSTEASKNSAELDKKSSLPMVLVRPIKTVGTDEEGIDIGVGFTESMIATLSNYNGVKILSSNTSFHVGKENLTDAQLKEQYNVDYTVEGTLQAVGSATRLTISLNDLNGDKVIWSEKSDFTISDIFKVQDSIGNKILSTLQIDAVTGSQGSSWAEEVIDLETFTEALNWRSEWRKFTGDGYQNSDRILKSLKKKIGNTGTYYNFESWQLFQKINFGLSSDIEKDKNVLKSNIEKAITRRGNAEDFALKALMELLLLSNSCEIAKSDAEKALALGGGVDVYTILGSVYSGCGDLTTSVRFTKMALELVPNDNGWFITNNLVSALYRLARYEEIRDLVEENIEAEDMLITILGVFASIEFIEGNENNAERLLKRAKSQGLDKERIRAWFNATEDGDKLIADLLKIGPLD